MTSAPVEPLSARCTHPWSVAQSIAKETTFNAARCRGKSFSAQTGNGLDSGVWRRCQSHRHCRNTLARGMPQRLEGNTNTDGSRSGVGVFRRQCRNYQTKH